MIHPGLLELSHDVLTSSPSAPMHSVFLADQGWYHRSTMPSWYLATMLSWYHGTQRVYGIPCLPGLMALALVSTRHISIFCELYLSDFSTVGSTDAGTSVDTGLFSVLCVHSDMEQALLYFVKELHGLHGTPWTPWILQIHGLWSVLENRSTKLGNKQHILGLTKSFSLN